ncbi:MAG: hypothetical protein LBS14_00355 [Holosporaceae bacterium]|jgi:hypothetical protein|nr:hypothetical protein [Holosporaceae bacterium]
MGNGIIYGIKVGPASGSAFTWNAEIQLEAAKWPLDFFLSENLKSQIAI